MDVFIGIVSDLFNTFGIPAVSAKPVLDFFNGIYGFYEGLVKWFQMIADLVELIGSFTA